MQQETYDLSNPNVVNIESWSRYPIFSGLESFVPISKEFIVHALGRNLPRIHLQQRADSSENVSGSSGSIFVRGKSARQTCSRWSEIWVGDQCKEQPQKEWSSFLQFKQSEFVTYLKPNLKDQNFLYLLERSSNNDVTPIFWNMLKAYDNTHI